MSNSTCDLGQPDVMCWEAAISTFAIEHRRERRQVPAEFKEATCPGGDAWAATWGGRDPSLKRFPKSGSMLRNDLFGSRRNAGRGGRRDRAAAQSDFFPKGASRVADLRKPRAGLRLDMPDHVSLRSPAQFACFGVSYTPVRARKYIAGYYPEAEVPICTAVGTQVQTRCFARLKSRF
jgi:hypothetical protein